MIIKVISLWDPWAWAMRHNLKKIETRSWYTEYRGWLGIQTAKKKFNPEGNPPALCNQLKADGWTAEKATPGLLTCFVHVNVLIKTQYLRATISRQELIYGGYDDNRWAWKTNGLYALESPIPMVGHQGLWDWEVPADLGTILLQLTPHKQTLFA